MNKQGNLFDILYNEGGYFGGSSNQIAIKSELNENIKLETILFNSSSIFRQLSNSICTDISFIEKVKIHCESINNNFKECAKSAVFEISKCIIRDEIIYIEHEDKFKSFYPSLRENEIAHLKNAKPELEKSIKTKKFHDSNRIVYYLGQVGGTNYGHWLIDVLPKIKSLIDEKLPTCLLLQSYGDIDKRKIESIKYLCKGSDIKIKFIPKGHAFVCEHIKYVSPVSYHPYVKNTNAINYLRKTFSTIKKDNNSIFEKIFVMRHKKHKRQIANLNQLLPILKERDFKIIDPENMSFTNQAHYFSNAKLIIGTMGAAMCNTVFSPSTAKILYLSPTEWMEPFYWDLASCIGQEYNVIYGKRCNNEAIVHIDDFTVDIIHFENAIHRLLM